MTEMDKEVRCSSCVKTYLILIDSISGSSTGKQCKNAKLGIANVAVAAVLMLGWLFGRTSWSGR